jgi:hypothetical protein
MCASLAAEEFDGFYSYSVFKSLLIITQCLVKMNILAQKIGAPKMDSKKQKCEFLENSHNELIKFQ